MSSFVGMVNAPTVGSGRSVHSGKANIPALSNVNIEVSAENGDSLMSFEQYVEPCVSNAFACEIGKRRRPSLVNVVPYAAVVKSSAAHPT